MRVASGVACVAFALVMSACGGGDDVGPGGTSVSVIPSTVEAASPPPSITIPVAGDGPVVVSGVISPGKNDALVTALREGVDTGRLVQVSVEAAKERVVVPTAPNGEFGDAVLFADAASSVGADGRRTASYVIEVDDHYHQCPDPQLDLPDFGMCQTVQVARDPAVAARYLSAADRESVGADSFRLETVALGVGGVAGKTSTDEPPLTEVDAGPYTGQGFGTHFVDPTGRVACNFNPARGGCVLTSAAGSGAEVPVCGGSDTAMPYTAVGWSGGQPLRSSAPVVCRTATGTVFGYPGEPDAAGVFRDAVLPANSRISVLLDLQTRESVVCVSRASRLWCEHTGSGRGFVASEAGVEVF